MATEYASLVFKVDSKGIAKAQRELDRMSGSAHMGDKATSGLAGSLKTLALRATAAVSAVQALRKVIDVARQFDVLNAQLITATGSAEGAAVAFEAIQDFATNTPYDLAQVTTAFVKLKNLGLDPSERSLVSYGNTASAMGKSLDQMIEAVADAATGEFERLKEFGIRASKQGDDVTFTFRGVSETVKFESRAIQSYLLGLGETEFSGAMLQRMASLDGALSNLSDEWDKLFLNIAQNGVGEVIQDGVRTAIDALGRLNESIASDELLARFNAFSDQFDPLADDFQVLTEFMEDRWGLMAKNIGEEGVGLSEFLVDAFEHIPTNIRSFIQILTVELLSLVDKTKAYGSEIMDNLQFWDGDTFNLESQLERLDKLRLSSIDAILQERDAALDSYESQMSAADDLYKSYKDRKKATLEGEEVGSDPVQGPNAEELVLANDHAQMLIEIEQARRDRIREMDEAEIARKQEMYGMLFSAADAYFSGLEGKEAAYARAALSIGENLLTEKGRQQLQEMWSNTYSAAMGAYDALASIPYIGPALGAAAAGSVLTLGAGFAGKMVSGGREQGGQVLPNNSYIVGERGPEVITMGSTAGHVSHIPKAQEAQSSSKEVIINQNITAMDAAGVKQVLSDNREYLSALITDVMNDRGMAA